MTSKEAFELLKRYEAELLITKKAEVNYDDVISARYEISKLVERDTPLKVIRGDDSTVISADCPKCKRVVDNGYKGCPFCLQRLDWRRTEKE